MCSGYIKLIGNARHFSIHCSWFYSLESIDKRIRLYEKESFKLKFKNLNCCFNNENAADMNCFFLSKVPISLNYKERK